MDKYEELLKNLRELIDMWAEVAHIDGVLKNLSDRATRRDCLNDLTQILDGDLSCIARVDGDNNEDE